MTESYCNDSIDIPERRDELIVHGYIRPINKNLFYNNNLDMIIINNFIPISIINLCFKFYHIVRDEWNKKLTKGLYKINENVITNIDDDGEWLFMV